MTFHPDQYWYLVVCHEAASAPYTPFQMDWGAPSTLSLPVDCGTVSVFRFELIQTALTLRDSLSSTVKPSSSPLGLCYPFIDSGTPIIGARYRTLAHSVTCGTAMTQTPPCHGEGSGVLPMAGGAARAAS